MEAGRTRQSWLEPGSRRSSTPSGSHSKFFNIYLLSATLLMTGCGHPIWWCWCVLPRGCHEALSTLEIPNDLLQVIQDLLLDLRVHCLMVTLLHTSEGETLSAEWKLWKVNGELFHIKPSACDHVGFISERGQSLFLLHFADFSELWAANLLQCLLQLLSTCALYFNPWNKTLEQYFFFFFNNHNYHTMQCIIAILI